MIQVLNLSVPYKKETGFFFALLILPKIRQYFAAEQQVRAFLIFAVLDIVQHPLEVLPSLDVLAGKALVRILPGNDHILVCRILPQLVTLGIQSVSVNLHRGGHSCIKIAFKLFLFQNLHLPHSFLLP